MAKIIGHQKIHSKKTDTDYIRIYFTWCEDAINGEACDSTVCGVEYFEKLKNDPENIRVGYNREKKSRFLYIGR